MWLAPDLVACQALPSVEAANCSGVRLDPGMDRCTIWRVLVLVGRAGSQGGWLQNLSIPKVVSPASVWGQIPGQLAEGLKVSGSWCHRLVGRAGPQMGPGAVVHPLMGETESWSMYQPTDRQSQIRGVSGCRVSGSCSWYCSTGG